MTIKIYVYMPDELVDVWRPIEAELVRNGVYRITSANPDPDDEIREFGCGDLVRCEERTFEDGKRGLVAVGRVSSSQGGR